VGAETRQQLSQLPRTERVDVEVNSVHNFDRTALIVASDHKVLIGLVHVPELIDKTEAAALLPFISARPFKEPVSWLLGKRRVVSFGWAVDDMPAFLLDLRAKAAAFAGLRASDLQTSWSRNMVQAPPLAVHKDIRRCLRYFAVSSVHTDFVDGGRPNGTASAWNLNRALSISSTLAREQPVETRLLCEVK
jgi:hypothetical protein